MILFVDTEPRHDREDRPVSEFLDAARTRLTYKLEDLAGVPVHLVRYTKLTPDLFAQLEIEAVFISGNSAAPGDYGAEAEPLFELIRAAQRPTFGFCGGHQLVARALGVDSQRLVDDDGGPGLESGYLPVQLTAEHELTAGLGVAPVFRQYHSWHVPTVPAGFVNLAESDLSPIQLMVDEDRRIVTTQFHPEYWTRKHPAGRELISAFLRWAEKATD